MEPRRLIWQRVRERMTACGLTSQNKLAAALGVAPSRVSNWRSGKHPPSAENLMNLARVLGVSTGYLFGEEYDARAQAIALLREAQHEPEAAVVEWMGSLTTDQRLRLPELLRSLVGLIATPSAPTSLTAAPAPATPRLISPYEQDVARLGPTLGKPRKAPRRSREEAKAAASPPTPPLHRPPGRH